MLHARLRARLVGLAALVAAGGVALVMPPFASPLLVAVILAALVGAVLHENRAREPHPY